MKAVTIYLLLLSLNFICSQDDYLGAHCDSKSIGATFDETSGFAGDYTFAHHGVASCASLYPYYGDETDDEPRFCCYTKVKYKLEGEKYTRKGCESVNPNNIDGEISAVETALTSTYNEYYLNQGELKDIDVSIDCNSNFLKYSALLFLIILF